MEAPRWRVVSEWLSSQKDIVSSGRLEIVVGLAGSSFFKEFFGGDFPIFEPFSTHPILTPPDFFGVEIGEPSKWWSMTIGDSVRDLEWWNSHYLGYYFQPARLQGSIVVNNPTYIILYLVTR